MPNPRESGRGEASGMSETWRGDVLDSVHRISPLGIQMSTTMSDGSQARAGDPMALVFVFGAESREAGAMCDGVARAIGVDVSCHMVSPSSILVRQRRVLEITGGS